MGQEEEEEDTIMDEVKSFVFVFDDRDDVDDPADSISSIVRGPDNSGRRPLQFAIDDDDDEWWGEDDGGLSEKRFITTIAEKNPRR